MHSAFYIILAVAAAFAAAQSAANPFNNPPGGYHFKAGTATPLSWKPTTKGTVSLKLQSGAHFNPETGIVIASNIPNSGSYSWIPEANLPDKSDYTVEIISDTNGEYNFTPRFAVAGLEENVPATTENTATAAPTHTAPQTTSVASTTTTTTAAAPVGGAAGGAATETSAPTMTGAPTTTTAATMKTTTKASTSSSAKASSSKAATKTKGTTKTTTSASVSGSASKTSVPNTNAGVVNRVSGGLMALAMAAVAAM